MQYNGQVEMIVQKGGTARGGSISTLLSNIYGCKYSYQHRLGPSGTQMPYIM